MDGHLGVALFPLSSVTAPLPLLRCRTVGMKRVITMAKNIPSKDTASRSTSARKSLSRTRPEKKKVRRAIFKSDEWYANAAMSIGIAGRPKGVRSGATAIARTKDRAD